VWRICLLYVCGSQLGDGFKALWAKACTAISPSLSERRRRNNRQGEAPTALARFTISYPAMEVPLALQALAHKISQFFSAKRNLVRDQE
jgi:hypothetical protein